MQQVKYPDLSNSNQETLSQQLFENTNQNIKFIPVVTQNQDQFSQSIQVQPQVSLNQVAPYQEFANYQVTQQPIQTSNLIKDQEFQKQKKYFMQILGIFILWTIVAFLIYIFFCFTLFRINRLEIVFFAFLFISVIGVPILIKIGIGENYRNVTQNHLQQKPASIFILFGLILNHTMLYFGILGVIIYIINDYWAGKNIIRYKAWLYFSFSHQIQVQTSLFEQNRIKMIYVFVAQLFVIAICGIFLQQITLFLVFTLPYPFCVLNVLKQIQKGRFKLQNDQVITASITAFYGMIICCED
ncbi:unnamed protein product (macronuclear) [Paramecium tetraurelia]|uniref:Transmembrane protein n=1 Tax=Paramecium tetraurelia TaxID=5888 RepID=A0DA53_PARTE|nr:uncharacterized protein GSPATT00039370001 [Paramecium tetraurelia]CAK79920.1 unnamed protein product [Paramecium tetraurelia]|eukprot:XP_001447317.1 hypothetical protein (macronuclear) [Paramecium tetraurelia strain d4-2]